MPQTLLALLALMLAVTFSINQREVTTAAQLRMIESEIGVMATGVANQVFDHIGTHSFDAAGVVDSPAQFRPAASFGAARGWETAATIDDFHGQSTEVSIEAAHGPIDFSVSAHVEYVERSGSQFVASTSPQYLKQVRVEVEGPRGFRAELARVYSYFDTQPGA